MFWIHKNTLIFLELLLIFKTQDALLTIAMSIFTKKSYFTADNKDAIFWMRGKNGAIL